MYPVTNAELIKPSVRSPISAAKKGRMTRSRRRRIAGIRSSTIRIRMVASRITFVVLMPPRTIGSAARVRSIAPLVHRCGNQGDLPRIAVHAKGQDATAARLQMHHGDHDLREGCQSDDDDRLTVDQDQTGNDRLIEPTFRVGPLARN